MEELDQRQNAVTSFGQSYMDTAHPSLVKWQLDYEKDLQRLKHEWSGEEQIITNKGIAWERKLKTKMDDEGINTIIPYMRSLISKAPLSNLTEDNINSICLTSGSHISDIIFLKYDDFQMDKCYCSLIVWQMCETIFIVLKRAQDEGEREFLKNTTHTSEIHTNQTEGGGSFFGRMFKH